MGNPKQKWTSEEEEALRAGVAKHGAGKWKNIQRDPEFNHLLYSRSNIDLKDKWRNLNVSANGQGPRDKSRTPKVKANPDTAAAAPLALTQAPASSTPALLDAPADIIMEDSPKCALDGNTASKYNRMIYDALSSLKEPNGSDTSTIVNFIEQRQEVPPNFRRLLSSRLRRLVQQDKLEKIQNCYKMKDEAPQTTKNSISISTSTSTSTNTITPKQKDPRPRQTPSSTYLGDTVEDAAISAAYKIAEAENKSFVAAEAVKEAERVSKMAEDTEVLLQLAKDIFDRCSRGEVVLIA